MTIERPNRIPLLLVAAMLMLLAACEKELPTQGRPARGGAVRVVTALVELRPMVDEIQALGTASANESIEIQPRIASRLERVAFEEGQTVAKGDLLVELENSEIVAGLALAKASLSESQSIYDRSKSLASTQAISASNLDQLLAQVKVNEAQAQAARARLDNTVIRAPFPGRVGLRRVSPGSFVNSQTIITTLDDVEQIKLDFSVPETFMTVLDKGMRIVARSIVYPDRTFEGIVTGIDTRLDPVTRAVGVRAIIPNDDGALKPGMFMTIDLQRDRGEVLVVPEQSIVPEGTNQYVFVVDEDVVRKQRVVIARRVPGFVVISDGIKIDERVVTEGSGKVRDGARVEDISNVDF